MEYLSVAEAKTRPGLRLVLSMGVPGPWGEAAKNFFQLKGIPFVPVGQQPGVPNPELEAWTGCDSAPVALYQDERPRSGWAEILFLAERLAPEPRLIPVDPLTRALLFGYAHEICGEQGFGWSRRLMMIHSLDDPALPAEARALGEYLGGKYGYSPGAGEAAARRVAEILELLARRLHRQQDRDEHYFLGDSLSALDVYWATFAALVEPLPPEQCPLAEPMRSHYTLRNPELRAQVDPILLEHRDRMYREHLKLPVDF